MFLALGGSVGYLSIYIGSKEEGASERPGCGLYSTRLMLTWVYDILIMEWV